MYVVFEWLVEILFYTVCGWIGYGTVKVLTFGRVKLPLGRGAESLLTEWIGVGVVIALSYLFFWVLARQPADDNRHGAGPAAMLWHQAGPEAPGTLG